MALGVHLQNLRENSIWRRSVSNTEEDENSFSDLLRWLIFVPLILLLIFGCGSLALIQTLPAKPDTRSYMAADYQPWEITVFKPLDPRVVLEILRDQELFPETFGEPIQPIIVPGSFWDPTETPVPGAPTRTPTVLTQTPSSTYTLTPTVLASATSTLTVTASHTPTPTPFGPPLPIPPGVPPANTYWFYDDTSPTSHMMYTTLPNGNNRSAGSASFHSPSFVSGQVLQSGTTTVNFYAWNPAPAAAAFTAELRGGGTLLGAGTFALPPNLFDAYFFSASFSTSSHNFADGERLEVSFSLAAPAEMYWDGAFNYSGVNIPLVATAPTPTASSTVTVSPTPSGTAAPSGTPTNTLTSTPVPPSLTPTSTPAPPTSTPTNTPVPPTSTPTNTATSTPSPTPIPCLDTYPGGLNYGPPDGLFFAIGCNQSHIIDLIGDLPGGSAISRDSNPLTYDFVYYERAAVNGFFENGILLDRVTIEVCVNSACSGGPNSVVVVFNWGDGLPDNNTNVGSLGLPETGTDWIDEGDLYNGTGIAIDVDAMVSGGSSSYQYLRVTAPGADYSLGAEIDSIAGLP